MNNNPIGVFDSGIGGITVLKSLINRFPNEDFIYVADTLNCPYGVKTPLEIKSLVDRITNYLTKNNAKAIVIACNTATAQAGHLFDLDDLAVLGVIYPTASAAIYDSKNVAVLATDSTITSGRYQELLLNAGKKVYPVKCSAFVPPIERGECGNKGMYDLVSKQLSELKDKDIDTVILGCTHFPLITQEIKAVLPKAKLISSGEPTSAALAQILEKRNLLSKEKKGKVFLKTTLDEKLLEEQIKIFDLKYENIEKINI